MTTTKPLEYWIDIRDVNRSHLGESVSWILKHNPKTRQINYDNEFLNVVEAQAYYETLDRITKLEAENAKLREVLEKIRDYRASEDDWTADMEDMQEIANFALKECEGENE